MPFRYDIFKKGEKKLARSQIRTRVDRVEKNRTRTASSVPPELMIDSSFL